MKFIALRFALALAAVSPIAQAEELTTTSARPSRTGRSFVYLGYNRSFYAPSNIHFRGYDHNFEIKNVTAADRPSHFSDVYVTDVSVPQYNIRWGKSFSEVWNVSIGIDHMKYVMNQGQTAVVKGRIGPEASEKYQGDYDKRSIVLEKDFLQLEHTDGLNYLSLELESQQVMDFIPWHDISLVGGLGFGPVIPRSDVRLFDKGKNHFWNLSGWSFSMHVGLETDFWDRYFVRFTGKFGRMELKAIPTTGERSDKAEQLIHFMENYMAIGAHI